MSADECNILDSIFQSFSLTRNGTCCSWNGVKCASGRVRELSFSGARLSGSIPPDLGKLSNLEKLHMSNNQFNNSIPSELGKLINLQSLYLYENKLSGPIPGALGNLSSLQYLYLHNNTLEGQIPADLGKLANLNTLDLSYNRLEGPIQPALGNLSKLEYLYLHSNNLSGPVDSLPNVGTNCSITSGSGNSKLCTTSSVRKIGRCWDNVRFSLPECAPTKPSDPPSGLSLAAIVGIIAAVCAVGIISFVAYRRFHGRRSEHQKPSDSESPSSSAAVVIDSASAKPASLDAAMPASQKPIDFTVPSFDGMDLPPLTAQSKDHGAGGAPNQAGDEVVYLGDVPRRAAKKDDSDVLYLA